MSDGRLRPRGGHGLPGAVPPGGRRAAFEHVVGGLRPPSPRVPAHEARPGRARQGEEGMATVCGHDEGGRRLIDLYLTDLAAELAFNGIGRRRAARILRGGARPPARARGRARRGGGDRAVRARRGALATRGRPRCSAGRRSSARPSSSRPRSSSSCLPLYGDPREHAAAGPVGRAARAPHVEALRLRRCVRDSPCRSR